MSGVGFDHYHYRCHKHPELGFICGRELHKHLNAEHYRQFVPTSPRHVGPHE